MTRSFDAVISGRSVRVGVAPVGAGVFDIDVDGRRHVVDVRWIDADTLSLMMRDDERIAAHEVGIRRVSRSGPLSELDIEVAARTFRVSVGPEGARVSRAVTPPDGAGGRQTVRSAMPGRIVRVLVAPGDRVTAGQGVIVVEAMKMENELRSPGDGVVQTVHATAGMAVEAGAALVVIE